MEKIENCGGEIKIYREGESGVALVITLMIMLILVLIGVAALMTSSVDLRITGNERVQKEAFYSADAGLNYGRGNPPLPLTSIDSGNPGPHNFTNPGGSSTTYNGSVTYQGATAPPIGSQTGSRAGFKAHHYLIESQGFGPNQAEKDLEMQGYRIGF